MPPPPPATLVPLRPTTDKTMMVTRGIRCRNCDLGGCTGSGASRTCNPGALFRLDSTARGGSWYFNWLDQDGSLVRLINASRPARPYLIGSSLPWWRLDSGASWQEPAFGNPWITPMPAYEVVARLDMRVETADGNRYTVGAFDGENTQPMGYVSHWGDISRAVPLSRTEGTTGMTGEGLAVPVRPCHTLPGAVMGARVQGPSAPAGQKANVACLYAI